jgi:hypothetical protein
VRAFILSVPQKQTGNNNGTPVLLRSLQNLLAQIYGIDIHANVTDYLVTDKNFLVAMSDSLASSTDEALFLLEEDGTLDISLYLNDLLLQRLVASNPYADLGRNNLDDFCKVLEGVSHFVYIAWNALNDKCVTRLELELQAEIDKYVSSRLLIESQSEPGIASDNLVGHLFAEVQFHEDLAADELERYKQANNMGGRYCHSLERRFPAEHLTGEMMQELRAFYRMPQPEKFSHMHTRQFA